MTRSLLIEELEQALNFPLTLLSAPAGFGKTTLLVQWRGEESLRLIHQNAASTTVRRLLGHLHISERQFERRFRQTGG